MQLPVMPPVAPMLAKAAKAVPRAAGLLYEPKWDGFRCIVFRDGDEIELGSRNERSLTRYFPELLPAFAETLPHKCVLDGEIVIRQEGRLEFEVLQQRIHPATSRVNKLAQETPASFIAFDLLAAGAESLLDTPFEQRRARLEAMLGTAEGSVHLTPITTDPDEAERWFQTFEGAGLDGVVAKPGNMPYRPDVRLMTKVKHERTADCVVAGFRWHKSGPVVGSLLLGLYDGDHLQHVGVAASFTMARRTELLKELAPYRNDALEGHPWREWAAPQTDNPDRMPGAVSRWNAGKDLSWQPLRPELVVEVRYDQLEGNRFRHTSHFTRWRPDRTPASCSYDQLDVPVRFDVGDVLRGRMP